MKSLMLGDHFQRIMDPLINFKRKILSRMDEKPDDPGLTKIVIKIDRCISAVKKKDKEKVKAKFKEVMMEIDKYVFSNR